MRPSEVLARVVLLVVVAGVVGAPLYFWVRTPLIHARVAESGGWSPDILYARAGEPLHLRLTSDDVTHGFAVGQTDMPAVDVEPGTVTDLTLTFDQPGTYTFYCTRWCGVNHWRMRGTIEVGPSSSPPPSASTPLYVTLGLDIDASHESPVVPDSKPSASQGQVLAAGLPLSRFMTPNFYRTHSPYQTWQDLRSDTSLEDLGDGQIWNLVAFIWQSNATSEGLAEGRRLFAQNCAACHGESGAGDGVFADQLSAAGQTAAPTLASAPGMGRQRPANFTDPKRMLGASPAILQGKILRGGMGTGMPSWGPIFTEDQTWELVSYLYSFQFGFHP